MMRQEVRKERIEKYGSFLFCPERETICFHIDTPDGKRARSICCKDDPEYIRQQEIIDENRRKNAEEEEKKRQQEKLDPPAPIRMQTKSRKDWLEEKIAYKENRAQQFYKNNKPKIADQIMHEVMILRRQLQTMKGNRKYGN